MNRVNYFRENMEDMIVVSFPGDEKSSGGCLAAGRGFFHINSHGGAEPCPFSPYSELGTHITKNAETNFVPRAVFKIWSAGLNVFAVE